MIQDTSHNNSFYTGRHRSLRLVLLLLVLLAFTRLVWGLDAKDLWVDESFSLQRAESDWPALIKGLLVITDGVDGLPTIDQHPFSYFILLGVMLRLAGQSEFALRFPSVMAATLLVPATWALARRFARDGVLPRSAPFWSALLAAVNPFFLWYGQEVRMYALVALLAVINLYLLLRWTETATGLRRSAYLVGYALTIFFLLSAHYFALLILPVQAAIVYQSLLPTNRRRAMFAAAGVLALALVPTWTAFILARNQGGTAHFAAVSLRMLAPDLINAFSLGLSVDISQVWMLDLVFTATAILGALFGLLRIRDLSSKGWVLLALVVIPTLFMAAINMIRPAYINARHMSLISGFYILLVGGGLAWLWQLRRWIGGTMAGVLLVATIYSSVNYFTLPEYEKGSPSEMGAYLQQEIQPGDILLWQPLPWWRLFRYYLPMDMLLEGGEHGADTTNLGVPMLYKSPPAIAQEMARLVGQYRRIWVAKGVLDTETDRWLEEHAFRVREVNFKSPISLLRLTLFLPKTPITHQAPRDISHPTDVIFGDRIRLVGYDLGRPLAPGLTAPVTLYWEALVPLDRRYKYILRLIANCDDPDSRVLAITEREPYDAGLPTTTWTSGAIIAEYSGVASPTVSESQTSSYCLTLQMYDKETLAKLPVTRGQDVISDADGFTVHMPYAP